MTSIVKPNGLLKDMYLPAVYLDSSVVIDYFMTEGFECANRETEHHNSSTLEELHALIRSIVRSDKQINKVAQIREKYSSKKPEVVFATSQLALWEFQGWFAESSFKELATESCGISVTKRMGKKQVGDFLKDAFDLYVEEKTHFDPHEGVSPLKWLMESTWINPSFNQAHGLRGIFIAEIIDFSLPPKQPSGRSLFPDPIELSYLQIGAADIMHLMFAHHLGCSYFATFDSDFARAREMLADAGMTLLISPEDILKVI